MAISKDVSISLHPDNLLSIDGCNEETLPYISSAVTAFDAAYQGLDSIHKAREAAATNPTLNDVGRLLVVAEFAEKKQLSITRGIDSAMSNLKKGIDAIDMQLSTPFEASAGTSISAEIRAHVKAMPIGERTKFLVTAQRDGDTKTLRAVLGAPAYLSGLTNEEATIRTRQYHEANSPELARRLSVMKKAHDMLGERGGLVLSETEKAIGEPWSKVNSLRVSKNRAEAAFK